MDGSGGGYECVGGVHAHTHAHTCMHIHVKHANHVNMDASMSVAICNFYTCIHVHMYVCMHVHVGGHPHAPRCP